MIPSTTMADPSAHSKSPIALLTINPACFGSSSSSAGTRSGTFTSRRELHAASTAARAATATRALRFNGFRVIFRAPQKLTCALKTNDAS